MKVYSFKCPACGYESMHQVGTLDMDQILTDLNTEFAPYRLFVCRKEKKFVHADILDAQFENKCPSDKTELEEVDPKQAVPLLRQRAEDSGDQAACHGQLSRIRY